MRQRDRDCKKDGTYHYLPACRIPAEITEDVREPSVNFMERQLALRSLYYCLHTKKMLSLIFLVRDDKAFCSMGTAFVQGLGRGRGKKREEEENETACFVLFESCQSIVVLLYRVCIFRILDVLNIFLTRRQKALDSTYGQTVLKTHTISSQTSFPYLPTLQIATEIRKG